MTLVLNKGSCIKIKVKLHNDKSIITPFKQVYLSHYIGIWLWYAYVRKGGCANCVMELDILSRRMPWFMCLGDPHPSEYVEARVGISSIKS
jgi:hypothetical protein